MLACWPFPLQEALVFNRLNKTPLITYLGLERYNDKFIKRLLHDNNENIDFLVIDEFERDKWSAYITILTKPANLYSDWFYIFPYKKLRRPSWFRRFEIPEDLIHYKYKLYLAAKYGFLDIIKSNIEYNIKKYPGGYGSMTDVSIIDFVEVAFINCQLEIYQYLINRFPRADVIYYIKEQCIEEAIETEDLKRIEFLIATTNSIYYMAKMAVKYNKKQIIKYLIINCSEKFKNIAETFISPAMQDNNLAVIKCLYKLGLILNYSILCDNINNISLKTLKYLIKQCIKLNKAECDILINLLYNQFNIYDENYSNLEAKINYLINLKMYCEK